MTFTSPADKTGGSAFPHNEVQPFGSAGMSLLDYFAVQLMAAELAREPVEPHQMDGLAMSSYEAAYCLIKVRSNLRGW
jgi:hypothetical protein